MKRDINLADMKIGDMYTPKNVSTDCVFKYHSIRSGCSMFELIRGATEHFGASDGLYPLGKIQWLTHSFKFGR